MIVAVLAGILVGVLAPDFAKSCAWIGKTFVSLVKMMISPVIFCTIVLGIGSVKAAASVGKAGGIALTYFITMSTFALAIGLVVGNFLHAGSNLHIKPGAGSEYAEQAGAEGHGTVAFLQSIVPKSLFSPLVGEKVLQTLFVALLIGFAVQKMGKQGEPILNFVSYMQKLVFRVLTMILWAAPIGAFGAIAGVVGGSGMKAVYQMGILMLGFYLTCFLFVFIVLGAVLKVFTGFSIFKLVKYLAKEYLLIFATSSSESALPHLMAKMEITVGIDRFMSEAHAITNFSGNAVATLLVGKWTGTIDAGRVREVLSGQHPFDYATISGDHGGDDVQLGKVPHPTDVQSHIPPTPYPVLPGKDSTEH